MVTTIEERLMLVAALRDGLREQARFAADRGLLLTVDGVALAETLTAIVEGRPAYQPDNDRVNVRTEALRNRASFRFIAPPLDWKPREEHAAERAPRQGDEVPGLDLGTFEGQPVKARYL